MESADKIEPKETVEQTRQERTFKKKYALSHFIITIVAYGVGYIVNFVAM